MSIKKAKDLHKKYKDHENVEAAEKWWKGLHKKYQMWIVFGLIVVGMIIFG